MSELQGTAAIFFPGNPVKEPLLCVIAAGLDIFPYVAVDEGCTAFALTPDFAWWRGRHILELRTAALDKKERNALRMNALGNWLDRSGVEFLAAVSNRGGKIGQLELKSCGMFWRNSAEKIAEELRNSGRLRVHSNPAFDYLVGLDSEGPAATCFLQALYISDHEKLTAKSLQERENDYMRSVFEGTGAQSYTFRKE